jgi:hypothetical protein
MKGFIETVSERMESKMKGLENRFLFRMVFVVSCLLHICYILLSNNYEGFWYSGCWNGWCYCFIPTIRDSCHPGIADALGDAFEMHAHEVHAHEVHAYEVHAYEVHKRLLLEKALYSGTWHLNYPEA